ncbi:hypothetical protein M438DRAFT_72293 [Aureobasidium pullulans EXF-150]|uniref:Uncharacterized protein n=1 Tax=Aureobasidium pullulans EXF-150 TaxID=1043002 RepID=A0A074XDM7_AURPU|nr:uncharacterized protein M438DRAFT_72293 [Aureobasidium pullulans EXF-150]KEQ81839.1 hypothetical protein M438DRAFT_72293 [Aureobasidium pullulans EXF-150]
MDISRPSYTYTTTTSTPIKIHKVFHILLFCLMGVLCLVLRIRALTGRNSDIWKTSCIPTGIGEGGHGELK